MATHRISDLSGPLLDAAVAKCEPASQGAYQSTWAHWDAYTPSPSTEWAQGGPIIERAKIAVYFERLGYPSPCWVAGFDLSIDEGFRGSPTTGGDTPSLDLNHAQRGPTPLIAAMRAYVASKLGEEVELP